MTTTTNKTTATINPLVTELIYHTGCTEREARKFIKQEREYKKLVKAYYPGIYKFLLTEGYKGENIDEEFIKREAREQAEDVAWDMVYGS